MSESEKKLQELIRMFRYKLYLEPASKSDELYSKWEKFEQDINNKELVLKVCDALSEFVKESLVYRLKFNTPGEDKENNFADQKEMSEINKLWTHILEWLVTEPRLDKEDDFKFWQIIIENKLQRKVSAIITEVIKSHLEQAERKAKGLQSIESTPNIKQPSKPIPPWQAEQENPITFTEETPQNLGNVEVIVPSEEPQEEVNTPIGTWKYLPISEHETDKYEEYIYKQKKSPEGLNLIGARVRGKMHKHNGTNCDDWFDFTVSGTWTIIAVSDGAGSKKLSRIGAKVSCEAAVKYLAERLENYHIKEGITHTELSTGEDINEIKNILHQAMEKAYQAVENKAKECSNITDYFIELDYRRPEIKDFYATLLLAVHTTIKIEETNYNLVLTCQVGDGMLAAISQKGELILLGKSDTGDYAGQTDFLTSKKKLEYSNLAQKTFHFVGNLKCLMVMTDGVADDYFPNNPGMFELYGDLVLNQIVNIPKSDEHEINQQLLKTNLGSMHSIKEVKDRFQSIVKRIIDPLENEPNQILISSIGDYAQELNKNIAEVVASPELLNAGILGELMCKKCQDISTSEKLLIWLDSYYRKGSFDDRTLVVLYQEV
ncbi:MAG: protein phosphatase 2C domain-containing protein [Sphaerospermopsis sp. SIO1G1]|nr:protein phosphatase 2C domain-containing protein [Sphaerospermopsis sp. SIO1G1]